MARTLATRFCASLTTRSYDPIDPDALEKAAGPDLDPLGIALEELGRRPETLAGEACFALAGRLGARLSPAEAAQAFDDATGQYQDIAPADAADGLISDLPAPPASAASCVAGFIWAALGDTAIATRWRAAHAVCVLVSLRETAVLGNWHATPAASSQQAPSSTTASTSMTGTPWYGCFSRWNAQRPRPTAPASRRSSRSSSPPPPLRRTTSWCARARATRCSRCTPPVSRHSTRRPSETLEAANKPVGLRPGRSPVTSGPAQQRRPPQVLLRLRQVLVPGLPRRSA